VEKTGAAVLYVTVTIGIWELQRQVNCRVHFPEHQFSKNHHTVSPQSTQSKSGCPESPEICYEYRNAIIAYHFQLGMQQQEICDRLKVNEAAVSKFIAAIKELVPNYQLENITVILAAPKQRRQVRSVDLETPNRRESDVEQDELDKDGARSSGERHASGGSFFQACHAHGIESEPATESACRCS
jgi:ribosome-binding protein aMBF1 (putative translation factor)